MPNKSKSKNKIKKNKFNINKNFLTPKQYVGWVKHYNNTIDSKKSLNDNFDAFRMMSKVYLDYLSDPKYNNSNNEINTEGVDDSEKNNESEHPYSSIYFSKLNKEEQDKFIASLCSIVNLICKSNKDKFGTPVLFSDIWELIHNKDYASTPKQYRKIMYSVSNDQRPVGKNAWADWNGFQTIDLDMKNAEYAKLLKPVLFDYLSDQFWFLGITLSTSGNGLHIWTKIKPLTLSEEKRHVEFIINFIT